VGYAGYIQLTTGNEATDLVITMFSAVLGVVFVGMGYGVRPKKAVPTQPPLPEPLEPSVAPKSAQTKPEKKPRKNAVRKRRPKKKTWTNSPLFVEGLRLFFAVFNRVFVSFLQGFFNAKTLLGIGCPFFAASESWNDEIVTVLIT